MSISRTPKVVSCFVNKERLEVCKVSVQGQGGPRWCSRHVSPRVLDRRPGGTHYHRHRRESPRRHQAGAPSADLTASQEESEQETLGTHRVQSLQGQQHSLVCLIVFTSPAFRTSGRRDPSPWALTTLTSVPTTGLRSRKMWSRRVSASRRPGSAASSACVSPCVTPAISVGLSGQSTLLSCFGISLVELVIQWIMWISSISSCEK